METLVHNGYHNGYRRQPITSDETCGQYREHLERLEAMIASQEDVVQQARTIQDATQLARASASLWRLLTKRQGVVDTLATYERDKQAHQGA